MKEEKEWKITIVSDWHLDYRSAKLLENTLPNLGLCDFTLPYVPYMSKSLFTDLCSIKL